MSNQSSKIIAFVGYSGSGKTTLITKIITLLATKGYKIGTIKHTHHDFEVDKPGKDSYLHFHSGAFASMIISDKKMAFVKRSETSSIIELSIKYFFDCDLVIVEGFKDYETPKILVHRRESGKDFIFDKLNNVIAVVSDDNLSLSVPAFDINDPENLANFIESNFLK